TICSSKANVSTSQRKNSSAVSAIFTSRVQGWVQMRMVPKAIPGRAANTANKAMRFSKSSLDRRERGRGVRAADLESPPELESIPLHPAVESATTQAQGLSRLTDVAVEPLQRFANQDALDFFDAEFFQVLPLWALHIQPQVRDLNLTAVAHQHRAFQCVFQFAHVAWPRILHHRLQGGRGKTGNRCAIACRIARQEMRRQRCNIFAPLAQGRDVDLNRIQPEKQVFPKLACGNGSLQIDVRRRDDAHVDPLGPGSTSW